ncbi:MAG: hypothetical protein ACI4P8_04360 [Akkermansia sp.]
MARQSRLNAAVATARRAALHDNLQAAAQREHERRRRHEQLLRFLEEPLPRGARALLKRLRELEELVALPELGLTEEERRSTDAVLARLRRAARRERRRACLLVGSVLLLGLATGAGLLLTLPGGAPRAGAISVGDATPSESAAASPEAPRSTSLALPAALPTMTGHCEHDAAVLQEFRASLRSGGDTDSQLYRLSTQMMEEIAVFTRLQQQLGRRMSYADYRELLRSPALQLYQPAQQLLEALSSLPEAAELEKMLHGELLHLSPEKLSRWYGVLAGEAPTFGSASPATAEQVAQLRELESNRALAACLYHIQMPDGSAYVSEEPPSFANGELRLRRSPFDPLLPLGQASEVRRGDPQLARVELCRTEPLWQLLGLPEHPPATESRLAQLLTAVVNTPAPSCPALARAYVFHHLLCLTETPDTAAEALRLLCPSLRADAASFRRVQRDAAFPLTGDCWLQPRTAAYQHAEAVWKAWFLERRDRDYAGELREKMEQTRALHAQCCGCADVQGEPVLNRQLDPERRVWYVDMGRFRAASAQRLPKRLPPLSPLVILSRF